MQKLFTCGRNVRKETPIDKSLFDLLGSTDEWCALYTPIGEPTLKRVQGAIRKAKETNSTCL